MPRKKEINGEHGVIIRMMEQFHKQNQKDINTIFLKMDVLSEKFGELPCGSHDVRIQHVEDFPKSKKKWRIMIAGCVIGMVGLIASGLINWGKMIERHRVIDTGLKKALEHVKKDEARWIFYKIPEGVTPNGKESLSER